MKRKLLALVTLMLCAVTGVWADGYTPSADEVIILNDVYSAEATTAGYSTHAAVAWGGTGTSNSKKAGDPNNNGAATSSNVTCYSVKGNGGGKNITLSISGCSKIIVYHESHSDRYVELRSGDKSGTLIGNGSTSTYYTEVDLDGTKSYSIFLHGTTGSDDQDFYVYAVKLVKYVNKTISTQALSGVKVNGNALTENANKSGYNVNESIITLTDVAYVVPTNVTLTNHITYTDNTTEDKNVAVTFDDTPSDGFWNGAATIGTTTYTVKVPYSSQSVTGVTINGTAISDTDLATLTSTKTVTIDGSSLNGIGMIGVTLSGGTANVTRTNSGNNVVFTFTINSSDEYTVTVTDLNRNYTTFDNVVYYSKDGDDAVGANTKAVTANGITFAMVDESKSFQYGSGKVTIGGAEYTPLKLSTGSAVNVTFPEGKKATKVKVYGWSNSGNGKMYSIQETSDANGKTVGDLSADIYYATNTDKDIYPSVYEYELDNWESLYFSCGGSASQPFIVMDFQFSDTGVPGPADPQTVTGDAIVWDFTDLNAASFESNKSYSFIADDGETEMRYSAGNNDAIEPKNGNNDGYLKENGTSSDASSMGDIDDTTFDGKTRLIRLFVTGKGTLTINCNSSQSGEYKVLDGDKDGDVLITTLNCNTESDVITVGTTPLWIETTKKGYITSIVWTPASDDILLTTTANMAGWRSFYDADNGYTLDENTTAYVATMVQQDEDIVTHEAYEVVLSSIPAVPAGMAVLLKTDNKVAASTDGHYEMTLTKANNVPTPDIINWLTNAGNTTYDDVYRLGYNATSGVAFFPFTITNETDDDVVVLDVDASDPVNGARPLTIRFADDSQTTAIKSVDVDDSRSKTVYDLQGRRVAQPGKGLYIVNGKKVIIK